MEVTLQDVLLARERRAQRQRELRKAYEKPLICFTMNIAGPEKVSPTIARGFEYGKRLLSAQLSGLDILFSEDRSTAAGCEAIYVVDADPVALKCLTSQMEDELPIGRLFDMDVLSPTGEKLSRQDMGLPPRRCLICSQNAYLCSRSRTHSVQQLQERTSLILNDTLSGLEAEYIASLAQRALLFEVCTTPKPGLVDRQNAGSHRDMDIFTFLTSTAALGAYFEACAKIGMTDAAPEDAFRRLRFRGRLAEQEMLRVTGGVNTHKGAIFTLGLLCAAAGSIPEEDRSVEAIVTSCAALTRGLVARDMEGITEQNAVTAGERLYVHYGITGIRGEAEAGFPTVVKVGLPVLEEGLRRGLSLNDAGCAALLAILAASEDTNLIARSSRETGSRVREEIRQLLREEPFPDRQTLEKLDAAFVAANLSPGGSADLLAASYFLHFLKCT